MLNKNLLLISLLVVGVVLTGCGKKSAPEDVYTPAPAPKVTFNVSGADAIGGREVSAGRFASGFRAAEDNSNDSALVKIMEDGTLESAFSCQVSDIDGFPEEEKTKMTKYAKLTDVFLPSKASNCSDVYLLFDDQTHFPAEEPDGSGIGYWCLSQLLCIHNDNSWTDLLYEEPFNAPIVVIDTKNNIKIASDGSLFILYREAGGWEYYIRKYDASTQTVSEICRFGRSAPLAEETVGWTREDWMSASVYVNELKISKDGKWAYIQVLTPSKNYIHVVSTENPEVFTDIELGEMPTWDYDDESNQLYYLKLYEDESATKGKLYRANYKGGNQTLLKDKIPAYNDMMVVAKNTIWIRSDLGSGTEQTVSFTELKVNGNTVTDNGVQKSIKLPSSIHVPEGYDYTYNCDDYYIMKGDAVYIWFWCDSFSSGPYIGCRKYNEIIKVPLTGSNNILRYQNFLPENNNIIISSWNVGDSKLYITGWDHNENPVNYEINLNGGTPKKVAEGQVFTCIGSLK